MYAVKHLYTKIGNCVTEKDPTVVSFDQIKNELGINVTHYAVVLDVNDPFQEEYEIHLSKILSETILASHSTWEEFTNALTEEFVKGYQITSTHTRRKARALCTSLFADLDMTLSYTNMDYPDVRNVRQFKEDLQDLVITTDNTQKNLKNYLCAVNGLVPYPTFFNRELFLKKGAKMLWSATDNHGSGISAIDFTNLGGIEVFKFADCKVTSRHESKHLTAMSDIKVTLPSTVNGENISIMVVIAGHLYFPDEIKRVDVKSFILKPYAMSIDKHRLQYKSVFTDTLYGTTTVETDDSTDSYIVDAMVNPHHTESFIVVINSPNVEVRRVDCMSELDAKTALAPQTEDGILVDLVSRGIIDHTAVEYISNIHIYTNMNKPMYTLDVTTPDHKSTAIDKIRFDADQYLHQQNRKSQYQFVQLFR